MLPILMNLAIQAVSAPDRVSAMGISQASYAFGMFVGPLASGIVADVLGLDAVFILSGRLSLAGLAVTFFATA